MYSQIAKKPENELMRLEKQLPSPTSSDAGYGSGDSINSPAVHTDRTIVSRRKKSRNAFSDDILVQLEKKFQERKYLMTDEREEFAQKIGLNENQIRTWFQNRRMRLKKQREVNIPGDDDVATQLSPAVAERSTTSTAEKITSADEPQPMTTITLPTIPPVLPTSYFVPPMHSSLLLIPSSPYTLSAPVPYYQPMYPLPMMYSAPTYYPSSLGYTGMAVGPVIGHPYSPGYPLVRHYPVTYNMY
uniref:Homeobox protein hoxa1-like mw n=1 Tax=Saccoglossus kowalevskii TaxID=10224 RepID=A0A0U2T5M0_SACKO|nr:homeobox protein hoxa1-like mw [Saccoglossus kowalevskii]